MADPLARVAVDTCVIVSVLLEEPDRLDAAQWVLNQHGKAHRLVIPAIVLAEIPGSRGIRSGVSTAKQKRKQLERVDKALNWVRSNQIQVIDIDETIARHAAELAAEHGLTGADACIVASAMAARCERLYTWDCKSLINRCATLPLEVCEPRIPAGTQSELRFGS